MKTEKNIIAVKPVKKYAEPKYPTKTVARQSPELLRKLPSRWEKNAKVVAAVGLLGAMTLTSCGILEPSKNNAGTENNPGIENIENSGNFLNVAPIFLHGNGTGAIGCEMIVPPVFMSEQEALAIIRNEAEAGGLAFGARPPSYTATNNEGSPEYDWQAAYVLGGGKVGLDLYDDEKQVAVAYIPMKSAGEIYLPDKDGNQMMSSVESFRPRELAERTIEDFAQQQGDINIGVLYEPGMDYDLVGEYWAKVNETDAKYYDEKTNSMLEGYWEKVLEIREEYDIIIRERIEEDLRNQIRDFIEWLQAQGII